MAGASPDTPPAVSVSAVTPRPCPQPASAAPERGLVLPDRCGPVSAAAAWSGWVSVATLLLLLLLHCTECPAAYIAAAHPPAYFAAVCITETVPTTRQIAPPPPPSPLPAVLGKHASSK